MKFPNLLIVASIKGGTTSVFRYLADHPDVCASSLKEINYFFRFRGEEAEKSLPTYAGYFKHCSDQQKIRLEASPVYMSGGGWIAERIMGLMGDAKIVFIIREPVARYLSHFNFWVAKTNNIPTGTTVAQAVTDGLSQPIEVGELHKETEWQAHATQLVRAGCYYKSLTAFLEKVPKDQISVLFFEDLASEPKAFMQRLCDFAEIDSGMYDDYSFPVENKTRIVKHKGLHQAIIGWNNRLQPLLNRFPGIRRAVRGVYFLVNPETKGDKPTFSEADLEPLQAFYREENVKLRSLLQQTYPDLELPDWVREA